MGPNAYPGAVAGPSAAPFEGDTHVEIFLVGGYGANCNGAVVRYVLDLRERSLSSRRCRDAVEHYRILSATELDSLRQRIGALTAPPLNVEDGGEVAIRVHRRDGSVTGMSFAPYEPNVQRFVKYLQSTVH